MKILLATPLYPPDIGGPSFYAHNMTKELKKSGHQVFIVPFGSLRKIPTIIRHILYFFKVIFPFLKSDRVICLDASSVGVVVIFLSKIFRKKSIIRLGGDFLWESYVERTKEKVTLSDFYITKRKLSLKEKFISTMVGFSLRNADTIAFNTPWLQDIICDAYSIPIDKTVVIENNFNPVVPSALPKKKIFLASSRNIKLKNIETLKKIFEEMPFTLELFSQNVTKEELDKIAQVAYAIVVVSFSEVNPNLILDGLSYGKPFILTKHTGLNDRYKQFGILVDPFDVNSIKSAIIKLCDNSFYESLRKNIAAFRFSRSWSEVTDDFLNYLK